MGHGSVTGSPSLHSTQSSPQCSISTEFGAKHCEPARVARIADNALGITMTFTRHALLAWSHVVPSQSAANPRGCLVASHSSRGGQFPLPRRPRPVARPGTARLFILPRPIAIAPELRRIDQPITNLPPSAPSPARGSRRCDGAGCRRVHGRHAATAQLPPRRAVGDSETSHASNR